MFVNSQSCNDQGTPTNKNYLFLAAEIPSLVNKMMQGSGFDIPDLLYGHKLVLSKFRERN